ncbi:glutamate synthase central domain-containing protein, partial [Caballeronia sordidicola]|uniref:glutamate synthase central domain-containing protein n=1 Tax=Caballeronia sordidicola TaxID=196367 RepID=UPI0005586471
LGAERNVFEETAEHADRAILSSPVVSPAKWRTILNMPKPGFENVKIALNYPESMGLEAALRNIVEQAEEAVRAGKVLLVLTDRHIEPGKLPVHAVLATGAVHHHLVNLGLRTSSN